MGLSLLWSILHKSSLTIRGTIIYVTGFAKMCIVHTKILIRFLIQLIATLNSYTHTMSPMARLKWSAFLRGVFGAL